MSSVENQDKKLKKKLFCPDPNVQRLDSANPHINRYTLDKFYPNLLCYPVVSDLSIG